MKEQKASVTSCHFIYLILFCSVPSLYYFVRAGVSTHMDDEYKWAGVEDPKVMVTTSRDPSSRLKMFSKVRPHFSVVNCSVRTAADRPGVCEAGVCVCVRVWCLKNNVGNVYVSLTAHCLSVSDPHDDIHVYMLWGWISSRPSKGGYWHSTDTEFPRENNLQYCGKEKVETEFNCYTY